MKILTCFEGDSPFEVIFNCTPSNENLQLEYKISGDIKNLLVEEKVDHPQREVGLWEKTCFEFFIKNKNSDDYFEFNFSTSLNWNMFIFHKIRGPLTEWSTDLNPISSFEIIEDDSTYFYKVILPWELFPEGLIEEKQMLYSPTTILKTSNDESFHYSSLHYDNKLDFHRFECFDQRL